MIARARPPGEYHVASASALPLPDDHVSHVLSVAAIYYTPDPGAVLAEWRRVARPGAKLMVLMDLYAENPVGEVWIVTEVASESIPISPVTLTDASTVPHWSWNE